MLSAPRELVVSNRSPYSLSLSWKPPAVGYRRVSGYRVQYRQSDAETHPAAANWSMVSIDVCSAL